MPSNDKVTIPAVFTITQRPSHPVIPGWGGTAHLFELKLSDETIIALNNLAGKYYGSGGTYTIGSPTIQALRNETITTLESGGVWHRVLFRYSGPSGTPVVIRYSFSLSWVQDMPYMPAPYSAEDVAMHGDDTAPLEIEVEGEQDMDISTAGVTPLQEDDCRRGIELTRSVSRYEVSGRPQGWRMLIEVTESFNMPEEIFLYMVTGVDPDTNTPMAEFQSVASPADIDEYPAFDSAELVTPGTFFFRLPVVDIVTRNKNLLEETWKLILSDRDELIQTLNHMCALSIVDVSRGGQFEDDDQPVVLEN